MTEWSAAEYATVSELQRAMAAEALSLLNLKGTERVLDLGCGNGKVTAEIAARAPEGAVVGIDASADMIAFASDHFGSTVLCNSDLKRLTSAVCRFEENSIWWCLSMLSTGYPSKTKHFVQSIPR